MSSNDFEKIMSDHSDDKLLDILKNRSDYQKEAIDVAIQVAIKRNLIIDLIDLETKFPSKVIPKIVLSEAEKNIIKENANKDMLYGSLWFLGGLIATYADFGFIFWGAIVFGAIQFFRGVVNVNSNN